MERTTDVGEQALEYIIGESYAILKTYVENPWQALEGNELRISR